MQEARATIDRKQHIAARLSIAWLSATLLKAAVIAACDARRRDTDYTSISMTHARGDESEMLSATI